MHERSSKQANAGGSDGFDDTFANTFVTSERAHFLFVFFGETERGEKVFLFVDVVSFDDGGKDGETILGIERRVKVVSVDSGDFL